MERSTEEMIDDSVNNIDERKAASSSRNGTTSRVTFSEQLSLPEMGPAVEERHQENNAGLARTLIYRYAHDLLHFDIDNKY